MKTQEDQLALLRDEVQAVRTVADAERVVIGGLLPMREIGMPEEEAGSTLLVSLMLAGFRLPCGCPPALRLTTFPEAHFAEVRKWLKSEAWFNPEVVIKLFEKIEGKS